MAGKIANRAPASRRRARNDRDGDVTMGGSVKGAAGIKKKTPTATRADGKPRRGGNILSSTAQREILRKAGAGDKPMRDQTAAPRGKGLVELRISNWQKSKAADNKDGGVSSLVAWIQDKASRKLGSQRRTVKVKKSWVEGDEVVINVLPEDVPVITRMNGFDWAGAKITIKSAGAADGHAQSDTEKVKAMLRGVLERRYDQETKLLDLSALGHDEELKSQQIFNAKSTASKFFPALMRVLESAFDAKKERDEAVISVSLANNELTDLSSVSTLTVTLPKLQNLDLSQNSFAKLSDLDTFRRRLPDLHQLILTGNPLESEPGFPQNAINAFKKLQLLNGIQVRTEEEIAKQTSETTLPFPIRSAHFRDEGGIAENFVRTFYAGFDGDRAGLSQHYYDDQSQFSLALNTHAPPDAVGSEKHARHEWESYIGKSRNFKRIQHLPARQSRLYTGAKQVAEVFAALPASRHPNLETEARKWMIETHIQPGVPDLANTPGGVDGFEIVIHGEFEEVDVSTSQAGKKRSFDRTFIIGPGGASGVRVVSDMLTVRSYGGSKAFEPDTFETWPKLQGQAAPVNKSPTPTSLGLPPGLTVEMAEQMVLELQKHTGMQLNFSKECIEQSGWNIQVALANFANVKAQLPPDAFVQQIQ
ncbi:hypothetical protein K431DRAFT_289153 [Polychaeton citri CBS 116435]|uniref:NTF2-like protein n=1 Tax=Polychaeton citri CBS 116435 TaxID=1314669 RepID=A0A9P4UIE1_9PEZI|nr:hypothetical protein K431DRAFT_289153 [Polychaeton citri CBS 116435]